MENTRKRRWTGPIPFGYRLDPTDRNYIIPNAQDLESLKETEEMIVAGIFSLREGATWLEYQTGKTMTHKGLHKNILKKYGRTDSTER